jgi:hypothetical protein
MALPIKANDTQEGCNPIASNCVIWQGPDIPCIKLCKGDTISDVTAKLAERLCTILDYLDVSAYDLSCFNPICPSPKDFQDLIQLLVDRICAINDIVVNPSNGGASGIGCPDCVVPVAQCLQRPDVLGNVVTTLQLKDYVILIGNEICTITTTVASLDSRVTSLESAVTDIQNNCCTSSGGGSSLVMPASKCLGTADGTPITDYLIALDTAFCSLQTTTGNQNDTNTALSYKCINGTDALATGGSTFNSLPGWIDSPTNLAQTVQDLWLVVCNQYTAINDLRVTIEDLQTQIGQCCNIPVGCDSIQLVSNAWFETTVGQGYYIVVSFDQVLSQFPDGWYFCPDAMLYRIHPSNEDPANPLPPASIVGGTNFDQIHYPGPWRTASMTGPWASVLQALYVNMEIDACVTDGTDQCFIKIIVPTIQGLGAQMVDVTMQAAGTPEAPEITGVIYQAGYPYEDSINTSWVMYLRLNDNNGPIVASHTFTAATKALPLSFTFNTGLLPGQSYGMTVDIFQRTYSKTGIQAINNAITPSVAP